MPFFDLIIRWVESLDFGPKSDELGHRILKKIVPGMILSHWILQIGLHNTYETDDNGNAMFQSYPSKLFKKETG